MKKFALTEGPTDVSLAWILILYCCISCIILIPR